MIHIKRAISVLVLSVFCFILPENSFCQLIAVSKDGRYLAFAELDQAAASAIGDVDIIRSSIRIVDTLTKKTIETIKTGNSENDVSGDKKSSTFYENLALNNKKLKQKAMDDLQQQGYIFNPVKEKLKDISITVSVEGPEMGPDNPAPTVLAKIFIKDKKSGYTMPLSQFKVPGGLEVEGKAYMTHDKKTYVVSYHTAYIMEFNPGYTGFIIINRYDLSRFNNGIGFSYYKKKSYEEALTYFKESVNLDSKFAKGIYNSACMYAITKKVSPAIEYLNMLKSLNTEESRKHIEMIVKEPDFNAVRQHPQFIEFMKGL